MLRIAAYIQRDLLTPDFRRNSRSHERDHRLTAEKILRRVRDLEVRGELAEK
jgi:hypothetical protein